MKIRNGNTPIQLPELIRTGDPITARWANSIRTALQRLRDRTPVGITSNQGAELNPFQVTLGRNPPAGTPPVPGSYYVVVSQGFVVERALSADGAESPLVLHECDNRLDAGDVLAKFEIEIGEAIFVKVIEDTYGRIKPGADVVLVVDDAATASTYFEPPSTEAEYYYKLAELQEIDDAVRLVPFLTGSHIYHSTGLTADMVIYDCPPEPGGSSEKGTQLIRLSFVSGKLCSVNETEAERPLSPIVVETNTTYCS
jgi:hypothetical protein